jgi:hypothetical protein
MLGISALTREGEEPSDGLIVHGREFTDLRPGSYRLGSFVRDRNANLFGSAEATLQLPSPKEDGIAGPVLFRVGKPHMRTDLPLWDGGEKRPPVSRTSTQETEPVPLVSRSVRPGENLEARSWLCSAAEGVEDPPLRYVSGDGTPLFRFEDREIVAPDGCYEISDTIETERLGPGRYTYHVRVTGRSEASEEFLIATDESD